MKGQGALVNAIASRWSRSGFGSEDTLLSECLSQPVLGTGTLNAGEGRDGGLDQRRILFDPGEVEIPLVPFMRQELE